MRTQLYLLANQDSGTRFTSLDTVKQSLEEYGISYDLNTVKSPGEAYTLAASISPAAYDALAVFGGDGTVIAVLKAAIEKGMRVLILPGGSGNVIAKTAGVTLNIDKALSSYAAGNCITRLIPVAKTERGPLVVDMHFELYTTSKRIKRWLGNKAYYVSAVTKGPMAAKKRFVLKIDGKRVEREAFSLFISNMGRFTIFGVNVLPAYRPGSIRVMLINTKNPLPVIWWWLIRRFTGRHVSGAFSVWRAQEVMLHEGPKRAFYDDQKITFQPPMTVCADVLEASVIVPVVYRYGWYKVWQKAQVIVYRETDHLRRRFSGVPSERFSRVSRSLYLGGQYGPRGLEALKKRGITGIVSMRRFIPDEISRDLHIDILHLPTIDMRAPSLESLDKGVRFIQQQVEGGGAAYVHCHKGEGRGPSMAAAYLMSLGMTADEAVMHLRHYRPFIRPNKQQMQRLYEFERSIRKM